MRPNLIDVEKYLVLKNIVFLRTFIMYIPLATSFPLYVFNIQNIVLILNFKFL